MSVIDWSETECAPVSGDFSSFTLVSSAGELTRGMSYLSIRTMLKGPLLQKDLKYERNDGAIYADYSLTRQKSLHNYNYINEFRIQVSWPYFLSLVRAILK